MIGHHMYENFSSTAIIQNDIATLRIITAAEVFQKTKTDIP
jgi:hypothetical protein